MDPGDNSHVYQISAHDKLSDSKDNSALMIFNISTHMLNIYIWDSGMRFPESTFER